MPFYHWGKEEDIQFVPPPVDVPINKIFLDFGTVKQKVNVGLCEVGEGDQEEDVDGLTENDEDIESGVQKGVFRHFLVDCGVVKEKKKTRVGVKRFTSRRKTSTRQAFNEEHPETRTSSLYTGWLSYPPSLPSSLELQTVRKGNSTGDETSEQETTRVV